MRFATLTSSFIAVTSESQRYWIFFAASRRSERCAATMTQALGHADFPHPTWSKLPDTKSTYCITCRSLTSTQMPRDSQLSSSAILTSRASKERAGLFLSIPGVLDRGGSNFQPRLPRS